MINQQSMIQNVPYSAADVGMLKKVTVVLVISIVISFINSFIGIPFLSSLVSMGGTIIFAGGIFIFSNKYETVSRGKTVALLLIIQVFVDLTSYIFDFLTPLPDFTDEFVTEQELIASLRPLISAINVLSLMLVISGIIAMITAYYFTSWFKDLLPDYIPKTEAYMWYGILSLIGQGILAFGLFSLGNGFNAIIRREFITSSDYDSLITPLLIAGIGGLIILAAGITFIIVTVKIYNRVNTLYESITSGRIPHSGYIYKSSYTQQPTFNQPPQSPEQYLRDSPGRNFCGNCGNKITLGSRFCENCGQKIQ